MVLGSPASPSSRWPPSHSTQAFLLPFVLFSCSSFLLKPFYGSLMGLSLVPWPLVTLISTRYTYLTISSQGLHMRENVGLSEPKLPSLICISLCTQDLLCGFLCECSCPHAWQVCGGQSTATGLSSHEAHVIIETTRETQTVTHAACFPSEGHPFTWKAEWMLFNNRMICYCFPQTPEHCFSVDKTHPHERGPTVANRSAIMFLTNPSSPDPHPEHPFSVSRIHSCGRGHRCSAQERHLLSKGVLMESCLFLCCGNCHEETYF